MKKNRTPEKKSLWKQLISGVVYASLASVVVAVTVNTTVGFLSKNTPDIPDTAFDNIDTKLPSLPEIPPLTIPESILAPVSDTAEGITAELSETPLSETLSVPSEPVTYEIPDGADLGIDRFIKPCDGYVMKEHSADIPVYSATMSDYRIHTGIDVTGDIGTPVACVCGGVITKIYDDSLLGKSVCIKTANGYTVRYSNLLPELNAPITEGATIKTGDIIGGIGDTALSEAVDSSHLHLEIYDADGNALNPEDLIVF